MISFFNFQVSVADPLQEILSKQIFFFGTVQYKRRVQGGDALVSSFCRIFFLDPSWIFQSPGLLWIHRPLQFLSSLSLASA